jgi:glycine/D-amino acid oxidase-like deaminating enzyme
MRAVERADVVVVGSGAFGSSIAYHLARAGVE